MQNLLGYVTFHLFLATCAVRKKIYNVKISKKMLVEWERESPGRVNNIFRALQNIAPSQLADNRLFDFASLKIDRAGERSGQLETSPDVIEQQLRFFKKTEDALVNFTNLPNQAEP